MTQHHSLPIRLSNVWYELDKPSDIAFTASFQVLSFRSSFRECGRLFNPDSH